MGVIQRNPTESTTALRLEPDRRRLAQVVELGFADENP